MKDRKHKIWLEFKAKEETPGGAILLNDKIKIINGVAKLAKKLKFDCNLMGLPTEVINYEPSGETIKIEKLGDIVEKLSPEQFEMFMIDLRKWYSGGLQSKEMVENTEKRKGLEELFGIEIKAEEMYQHNVLDGMTWLDTGENKTKTTVEVEH